MRCSLHGVYSCDVRHVIRDGLTLSSSPGRQTLSNGVSSPRFTRVILGNKTLNSPHVFTL